MNTNDTPAPVYTYRTTPSGDGRYYVWRKYDSAGAQVEVGQQLFTSEADAEKAVRSLISGDDILAVTSMNSVDAEDNAHVVHEVAAVGNQPAEQLPSASTDGSQSPAEAAVIAGDVAPPQQDQVAPDAAPVPPVQ
jgi:hypothetical protein